MNGDYLQFDNQYTGLKEIRVTKMIKSVDHAFRFRMQSYNQSFLYTKGSAMFLKQWDVRIVSLSESRVTGAPNYDTQYCANSLATVDACLVHCRYQFRSFFKITLFNIYNLLDVHD